MSTLVPINNTTLPDIARHALWNHTSGLVVSLLGRELPKAVAERGKPLKTPDYHLPRLLQDADIYLAFYPKRLPHSALFAPLALRPEQLESCIVPMGHNTGFALNQATMDAWIIIEETLLSIIRTLMTTHPSRADFPLIAWPHWPEHTGYRESHSDRATAFKRARYAKQAFTMLAACATFAISFWLDREEHRCFARAWDALSTRPKDPIPLPFLDSLEESMVCILDAGFRAGAFLSPYHTHWGRFFRYFIRARVPLWLIWGFETKYNSSYGEELNMRLEFFPPNSVIMDAQSQSGSLSIIPPHGANTTPLQPSAATRSTGPPAHFWSTEIAVRPLHPGYIPPIEAGSRQRSGESWEAFSRRMKEGYATGLLKENPQFKQSRLIREEQAAEQRLSKGTTVFTWEQDSIDPSFYRRSLAYKNSTTSNYVEAYPYRWFYWGHIDEWDIVGHLESSSDVAAPDLHEDDYNIGHDSNEEVAVGLDRFDPPDLAAKMQRSMAAAVADNQITFAPPTVPTLQTYLRLRHGFTCPDPSCWNPGLHCPKPYQSGQIKKAAGALLFSCVEVPTSIATSVVDCFNMVRNNRLRYTDLTVNWDFRWVMGTIFWM